MTYDVGAAAAVIHGGDTVSGPANDRWSLRYVPLVAPEACGAGPSLDTDGDGLIGCADDDCWAVCSPSCPPTAVSCDPTAPACGDGVCDPGEDCRACPDDCATGTAACPIGCGDFQCDAGESAATCPGDCAA